MGNGFLSAGTADHAYSEMLYRLGFGLLKKNMKLVAKVMIEGTRALTHGPNYHWARERDKDYEFAVGFVQGSGLNLLIESFGLEVDPEVFRETFLDWADYERRKCKSSLSSPTIEGD